MHGETIAFEQEWNVHTAMNENFWMPQIELCKVKITRSSLTFFRSTKRDVWAKTTFKTHL